MAYYEKQSEKILLKNIVNIRWIAIIGQLLAVIFTNFYLNISIPLFYCLSIISVSILVNLLSLFLMTRNNYLSENEFFYFLLYDTIQLAILLYLTGGIYNPFCLLLIAPVVISATHLKINYSVILSMLSILIVFFLNIFYIEINWKEKFSFPSLFVNGLVLALIISIIFIAIYVYILADSSRKISNAFNQTRIALINQKKISEIDYLAAAATHELSTPLNTILLVLDDLKKNKLFTKDLLSEILLLETQANRCKEILLNLSKNPQNIKDTFLQKTTLTNLITLNFGKFLKKKNHINTEINVLNNESEPIIFFSDELMYGLGNIIQNASQHAKNKIDANISWNKDHMFISIEDDGNGFKSEVLERIGDPYISQINNDNSMGLGIFIAKNLIENIGGNMKFYNKSNNQGSVVDISLKRNI